MPVHGQMQLDSLRRGDTGLDSEQTQVGILATHDACRMNRWRCLTGVKWTGGHSYALLATHALNTFAMSRASAMRLALKQLSTAAS